MSEDREHRRTPFFRAGLVTLTILAVVGAAKVIVDVPVALAKTYGWPKGVQAAVMVGVGLLLTVLFFTLWAYAWFRDILNDAPIAGLTEKEADALKKVACRIKGVKDRRGNRMTMMAGICVSCTYIEGMIEELRYFANRRYSTLATEIGRESEFGPEAMNRLADMGVLLSQDFKVRRDFYADWHDLLVEVDGFPANAELVMEQAGNEVEEVVRELQRLAKLPDAKDQTKSRKRRDELHEKLQKLEVRIRSHQEKLVDLSDRFQATLTRLKGHVYRLKK